jgi:predicted SprT family Zn-dependent metalloprotease
LPSTARSQPAGVQKALQAQSTPVRKPEKAKNPKQRMSQSLPAWAGNVNPLLGVEKRVQHYFESVKHNIVMGELSSRLTETQKMLAQRCTWSIDNAKTRLGATRFPNRAKGRTHTEITFSRPLIRAGISNESLFNCVLHEFAHAMTPRPEDWPRTKRWPVHGPAWTKLHKRIGGNGKRCVAKAELADSKTVAHKLRIGCAEKPEECASWARHKRPTAMWMKSRRCKCGAHLAVFNNWQCGS